MSTLQIRPLLNTTFKGKGFKHLTGVCDLCSIVKVYFIVIILEHCVVQALQYNIMTATIQLSKWQVQEKKFDLLQYSSFKKNHLFLNNWVSQRTNIL